jgi:hypothetical protein
MKYIFVTGAPGSKWSSVVKNIYYSASLDRSDSSKERTYRDELHLGAYWDPGMEFGKEFDRLNLFSREQCEIEFDRPFSGSGTRIIKSHVFAHHIDFIKQHWPQSSMVVVQRSTDACLGWWIRCGGFDIAYPNYKPYYQNIPNMINHIEQQNIAIDLALSKYSRVQPRNNLELAKQLGLEPPQNYHQDFESADITVSII